MTLHEGHHLVVQIDIGVTREDEEFGRMDTAVSEADNAFMSAVSEGKASRKRIR